MHRPAYSQRLQRGALMGSTLMLLLVGGLFLSSWISLLNSRSLQVSWLEDTLKRRISVENSRLLAWQNAMEHGLLPAHDLGSLVPGVLSADGGGILPVKGWNGVDALASMLAPGTMPNVFPYNNTGLRPGPAFLTHATQVRPTALAGKLDSFTSHLFLKSRPPMLSGDLFVVFRKPDNAVTEIDIHKITGAHHAYWQVNGRTLIHHPASLFSRTTSQVSLPFRTRSLYLQNHDPFNNTPISALGLDDKTLLPSNLPVTPGTVGPSFSPLLANTVSALTESTQNLLGGQNKTLAKGKLLGGITNPIGGITDPIGVITDPIGVITDPIGVITDPIGVITDPIGVITDPIGVITDPIGVITDPIGGITNPIVSITDILSRLTESVLAQLRALLTIQTGRVLEGHLNVIRNDLQPSNSLHHIINREVAAGRAGVDDVDVYIKSSDTSLPWWMQEYTGLAGDTPPHPPPGYPSGYPTQFKTLYVRLNHPGLRHLRIRNVIHQIVFIGQSTTSAFEAAGAMSPVIITLIQDQGQPVGNIAFENENNRRLILGCRHPYGQKLDLSWVGAPITGTNMKWRLSFINEYQSVWLDLHKNPTYNIQWIGGVMTNWFFKRYNSTGPRAERLVFMSDNAVPTLPHSGPPYATLLPRELWVEQYFLPTPPSS